MVKFKETKWNDCEFSQNYRNDADVYLPFRRNFIEITRSLYSCFIEKKGDVKVLDLGCGDGLFIEELLKTFTPESVTLVDGSLEMLNAAKKRMDGKGNLKFIHADFQDLLSSELLENDFDFIFSSLAIHHIPFKEKTDLYSYIYRLLSQGGCFVLYDVVVPPSGEIEKWYLALWREWIKDHPYKEKAEKLLGIPEQYKENSDNIPDTLESQLDALKKIGFTDIDCYFKYGIFSLFGGFK